MATWVIYTDYAATIAVILGMQTAPPDGPLTGRDPASHRIGYGESDHWYETYVQILWRSTWWGLSHRDFELSAESSSLRAKGILGVLLAHLVDCGQALARALTDHAPLDLTHLLIPIGQCRPRFLHKEDGYVWQDYSSRWLELFTQMQELNELGGTPAAVSYDDAMQLIQAARLPWSKIFRWLEFEGLGRANAADAGRILDFFADQVEGLVDFFGDRAKHYGELACCAAAVKDSVRADRLLERAASNLMAHGFRKDTVLSHVLETVDFAEPVGYDGEPALLRLSSFIRDIQGYTDGKGTSHLSVSLLGSLIRQRSDTVPAYVTYFNRPEHDLRTEEATALYLRSLAPDRPAGFALAGTLLGTLGRSAAKDFWERHLAHLKNSNPEEGDRARAAFETWLETDYPHAKEDDYRQISSNHSDLQIEGSVALAERFADVTTGEQLLALFETGANDPLQDEGLWADLLRNWEQSRPPLTHVELCRVADWWLGQEQYSSNAALFDVLYDKLMADGERSRAFDCLIAAQQTAYGFYSYWGRKEDSDARLERIARDHPNRHLEFVVECLSSGGSTSTAPRVVDALVRFRDFDLAEQITGDFVEFGMSLAADARLVEPLLGKPARHGRSRCNHLEAPAR